MLARILLLRYTVKIVSVQRARNEETTMQKTIVTVVGKDTVGIIAKICTYFSNNQINILDISQTIIDGFFNMMMIVDTSKSAKTSEELVRELKQIGEEIGVIIRCQREDIFNSMHRL